MESIVYFVMSHGTMVITVLLGSVILCVFGLLLMTFHNPKDMIANEVGTIDRLEGVLRQMLSEQQWPTRPETAPNAPPDAVRSGAVSNGNLSETLLREQLKRLEAELSEKQKQIESYSSGQPVSADQSALKLKIKELEEKLTEYSVIEEDIADLSRFRQENNDLRKKVGEFAGVSPSEASTMPWDEFERIVKTKKAMPVEATAPAHAPAPAQTKPE